MYLPALPVSVQMPFMQLGQGTTRGARLDVLTTGKIRAYDAPGTTVDTTTSVATGQWIRIEWHVIHSATVGQIEVKLFNTASDVSPTETLTSPANLDTLANATRFDIGVNAGQASGINNGIDQNVYLDAVVANATSYPGPFVGPVAPQVLSMQAHVGRHTW
jgi:hypothetical protein